MRENSVIHCVVDLEVNEMKSVAPTSYRSQLRQSTGDRVEGGGPTRGERKC